MENAIREKVMTSNTLKLYKTNQTKLFIFVDFCNVFGIIILRKCMYEGIA